MSNPNYRFLSFRRDLERRNLSQLKQLAKEQGLGVKDAAVIGSAQRRSTWIKLLIRNTTTGTVTGKAQTQGSLQT